MLKVGANVGFGLEMHGAEWLVGQATGSANGLVRQLGEMGKALMYLKGQSPPHRQ